MLVDNCFFYDLNRSFCSFEPFHMLALTNFITKVNILIKLKKNTMKTTNFKGFFLSSILLSFFLLSGCKDPENREFSVFMKNNSSLETHLWTMREGIDPSNKLAPGAERSSGISWVDDDTIAGDLDMSLDVTVYAGRNGATLTSKTFTVKLRGTGATGALTVVYSGGALSQAK